MYARVSRYEGGPTEKWDEAQRYAEEYILPQARQLEGWKGVIALGDRETRRSLTITLWESEEAMRASEEAASQLRQSGAESAGDTITAIERYEVTFFEPPTV